MVYLEPGRAAGGDAVSGARSAQADGLLKQRCQERLGKVGARPEACGAEPRPHDPSRKEYA